MASTAMVTSTRNQQMKRDRGMFSASEDSAMMKQIHGTHSPDGRQVDVIPVLQVIEEILHQVSPQIKGDGARETIDSLEEKLAFAAFDGILEGLAYIVHKISCELSCKCSGGGDAHASTMAILSMLSSYQWDAKLVTSLAAFAVVFGEFWLIAQLFTTHPLAKSLAVLKQMPNVVEHSQALKSRFDAINDLVRAMLDVTQCVVVFNALPSQYITDDTQPMSIAKAHIPAAVYWTIRSMVASATQITSLLGMNFELISSNTETWELSSLAHKLRSIHDDLKNHLRNCHQHIDEKKHIEYYNMLIHLFEITHVDNLRVLKAILNLKGDVPPLELGTTRTQVNIDTLRRRTTLLLISGLNLSIEEQMVFTNIVQQKQDLPYDVVWIPILDSTTPWNEEQEHKFRQLQKDMPWYTLTNPSLLEPAVVRYIKEVWRFTRRPMLVVLDHQGKVSCTNALHMFWIWGNLAYPFNSMKEEGLWKEESWRLELLVDGIDPEILDWIAQEKFICLYGGEDLEWIRKFTAKAKQVAQRLSIQLDMVYVGKSSTRERVRKISEVVAHEGLSHSWENPTMIWYFWTRLESMLHSKMQHGMTVANDKILQEVVTMLSFDGSDQGWALFSRGAFEMAKGKMETIYQGLEQFQSWEEDARTNGLVPALSDELVRIQPAHHCNRLIFPGIDGDIPEMLVCAECGRTMEKFLMYRCCTD